ncbi:YbgC/FadM family acyl-CoA thioesterase [Agaribacterium haliotis]|uniref:YbgC/FadM family acyl-CoA thioesterase n=1 Tax=Agaribacterium haliotis TaxID=2013869 RepID=UPI000BB578CA|nr:YbgC/FadM family acyl-CoA thioesterase [Agaribacterium haliotis]
MAATEFFSRVRVYIEDTDAGGVVYYPNYLKFMERARSDFLRKNGVAQAALPSAEHALVVASASIDYKKSARLDDELFISARPVKLGRSFVLFEQQLWRQGAGLSKPSAECSDTLAADGSDPAAKGFDLIAKGSDLIAEGYDLIAEGFELIAEGSIRIVCVDRVSFKPKAFTPQLANILRAHLPQLNSITSESGETEA